MKLKTTSQARSTSFFGDFVYVCQPPHQRFLSAFATCSLAAVAIASAVPQAAVAMPAQPGASVAQALPTPLPPLPASGGASLSTGEQYLVLVNGNSDLLLQQVRQVEPGAFVNYVGGQSVIQAGRFNSYQNAQVRANELANFGIGAEVQATDFAGAPIAVTPPADYDLSFPTPAPTALPVGQAPSATAVAATPSSIEFGQAAPFQPSAPASSAAFPPPTSVPTQSNVAPPPTSAPVVNNQVPSGYYVVIPGGSAELQNIANRVMALGAPNSLVLTRTSPRGPHVAVGPYNDPGIAQEWTNYLRDSGLAGARVHFE